MGTAMGIAALVFFPFRFSLRWARRGLVATLVALQVVMTAPVWHLISRIDLVGGSTGYHRHKLIDSFVRNVDEWFLMGTNSTAHWGWGMVDTANLYVSYGVRGGIIALALFITILVFAYKQNGGVLRRVHGNRGKTAYSWALGTALFMHTCMFFAVSYFGQIHVVFYGTLGAISSLSVATQSRALRVPAKPEPLDQSPVDRPDSSPPTTPGADWAKPTLADGLIGRRPQR
jgi:hypothetical protein